MKRFFSFLVVAMGALCMMAAPVSKSEQAVNLQTEDLTPQQMLDSLNHLSATAEGLLNALKDSLTHYPTAAADPEIIGLVANADSALSQVKAYIATLTTSNVGGPFQRLVDTYNEVIPEFDVMLARIRYTENPTIIIVYAKTTVWPTLYLNSQGDRNIYCLAEDSYDDDEDYVGYTIAMFKLPFGTTSFRFTNANEAESVTFQTAEVTTIPASNTCHLLPEANNGIVVELPTCDPADAATAVEEISTPIAEKMMRDGMLLIRRGSEEYTIMGGQIR